MATVGVKGSTHFISMRKWMKHEPNWLYLLRLFTM